MSAKAGPGGAKPRGRTRSAPADVDRSEIDADRVAERVNRSEGDQKAARSQENAVRKPGWEWHSGGVDADVGIVNPAMTHGGTPLTSDQRAYFEPRLGADLSEVRLHTDSIAADAARAVDARAFTVGRNIVFGSADASAATALGGRVLAHELAHVVQQAVGVSSGIQRLPAAPGTAKLDRAIIKVDDIPDLRFTAGKWEALPTDVGVTVVEPAVAHISWEVYDHADILVDGMSTIPGTSSATSMTFKFQPGGFSLASPTEGRYVLRCVGLNAMHRPIAYSDRSFYVWATTTNISQMDLASVGAIRAAPGTHSLGEIGAADARRMLLEHRAAVAGTGTGTIQGNHCPTQTPGVPVGDCTTFVMDVLERAFTAKGRSADWKNVVSTAKKASAGGLKGTELLKALESKAGWRGVFWSPDPRNPADTSSEHPVSYRDVGATGKYYGVAVAKDRSIIDFRPTAPDKLESMTTLDELKAIPLGVIAARGGKHMTLILNGNVYEVHWDRPASDPNAIEATPLERWAWLSGVIVFPP